MLGYADVGQREVILQTRILGAEYLHGTVSACLLGCKGCIVAYDEGFELTCSLGGQTPPFGKKFQTHLAQGAVAGLAEYHYFVHLLCA